MAILRGASDFFGLDIGSTAIRAVQLHGPGPIKTLGRYGHSPITGASPASDAVVDQQKIAQMVRELLSTSGITSKNVAVNLPSSRVFTTVIDMGNLSEAELAKSIKYQADSYIPTPLAKSKIDWAILGPSPVDKNKVEVLLTSSPNEFIESRIKMLESIDLNVVAVEADYMAMSRALTAQDSMGTMMVLDMGYNSTDLVILAGGAPRLCRSIPIGVVSIIRACMQNLGIDANQAQQFVLKFGLGKDKLEGKVYNAITGTVETLMSELEKSIKFSMERYISIRIEKVIVSGGAATIPELPLFIANRFNINVEIGNAWRNVNVPPTMQNELAAISNHFAVAVGLAERNI